MLFVGCGGISAEHRRADEGGGTGGSGRGGSGVGGSNEVGCGRRFEDPDEANPGYETTAACGDGRLGPGEACDDGNTDDDENTGSGDGCDERCRVEDGWVCAGEPSDCRPTVCGDGLAEGSEGCDDGNTTPLDGCSTDCRHPAFCGDAVVQPEHNEQCDDGLLANRGEYGGCRFDCQLGPRCGDGNIDTAYGEECDPGADCTDSPCSQTCKILRPR